MTAAIIQGGKEYYNRNETIIFLLFHQNLKSLILLFNSLTISRLLETVMERKKKG